MSDYTLTSDLLDLIRCILEELIPVFLIFLNTSKLRFLLLLIALGLCFLVVLWLVHDVSMYR
jgi:hypothetical protein